MKKNKPVYYRLEDKSLGYNIKCYCNILKEITYGAIGLTILICGFIGLIKTIV
jgi:hypothetical protein